MVIKLISLAAQKFLTDLAKESYTYSKQRQATTQPQAKNKRNVLLLDDVSRAVWLPLRCVGGADGSAQASKFGVSMNKLEYVADSVTAGTTQEAQPQQQPQQPGHPQHPQYQQQQQQQQQQQAAGQGAADKKTAQSRPKKKTKV